MTDDTTSLSPRHERLVAQYLNDLNATQAYIRAGYAPRGAAVNASKLLKQPRIQEAGAAGLDVSPPPPPPVPPNDRASSVRSGESLLRRLSIPDFTSDDSVDDSETM